MSDDQKAPRLSFGGTQYYSGPSYPSAAPLPPISSAQVSANNVVPSMTSGSESIAPSEIPLAPFFDMKAEIPPEPVDATAQADDDDNDDKKSQNSSSSKGVGRSRPLVETFTSKLLRMKALLLAVFLNAIMLGATGLYLNKNGFELGVSPPFILTYGSLFAYALLRITNISTSISLDQSTATFFGYMLASEKGFSLTGAGFLQIPFYGKVSFAQRLPIKSIFKKLLEKMSWIWIFFFVVQVFPIFIATQFNAQSISQTNVNVDCIYFTQAGNPHDRKWPNVDVESGVGEFVFGSSIGYMRSEMNLNYTTAIFPPTIIAAVNNGDIIQGPGFTVDIYSHCECTVMSDPSSLITNNVDPWQVNAMLQKFKAFNSTPGMVFGINATINSKNASDPNSNYMVITNIFSGYDLCGADGVKFPMVCTTNFTNHMNALVQAQFMTDGTSASIAIKDVQNLRTTSGANFTWLAAAMNNLLNGPVSSFNLTGQLASSTSPLIWWTTPNLISVDRGLIDAGLETMYAILFRGALQRTYGTQGYGCPWGNTVISQTSRMTINTFGYQFACAFFALNLIICGLGLMVHVPWFLSKNPIGPATRLHNDNAYFATLLSSSSQCQDIVEMCNSESFEIWQALDHVVRVGESLNSYEDDIGQIILEKPKVVRNFRNGRRYT